MKQRGVLLPAVYKTTERSQPEGAAALHRPPKEKNVCEKNCVCVCVVSGFAECVPAAGSGEDGSGHHPAGR